MGKTGDKRKAPSSSRSEPEPRYGPPRNYQFDEWTYPHGYTQNKKITPTAESKTLLPESHPWLRWPGADKYEKIRLNNNFAEIQKNLINPPRMIDWGMLEALGIKDRIDRMLETKCLVFNEEVSFPMWDRIFRINEAVYREWCLEFYSSLWIDEKFKDSEIESRKIIHFRCGGKERHCTIAEFGYLTGMFPREELAESTLYHFLGHAARDTTGFSSGSPQEFWTEISGNVHHSSNMSKVADIYDPVLRILHKMFTYNFLQRSNQNDKMYLDDLWLLRLFVHGAPFKYACAPYTLATYMEKHHDVTLCCGHFISKIVQNLGCAGDAANRECAMPVEMRMISWRDLMHSKLLRPGTRVLIEPRAPAIQEEPRVQEEAGEQPHLGGFESGSAFQGASQGGFYTGSQGQEDVDPYSMQAIARQLGLLQESQVTIGSKLDSVMYHQERYQPYMESWAEREAASMGRHLPQYSPPDIFTPMQRRGGFYYPPRPSHQQEPPRNHDHEAGGSGAGGSGGFSSMFTDDPPIFGTHGGTFEGGGAPSVFGDPNDPQNLPF